MSISIKSAEKILEMGNYFAITRPTNPNIAKWIFTKGVELYPANFELVMNKGILSNAPSIFMKDLNNCIKLNPKSVEARLMRVFGLVDDNPLMAKQEAKIILDMPESKTLDSDNLTFLKQLANDIKAENSKAARKLKPLALSSEQIDYNKRLQEFWNYYKKDIEKIMEQPTSLQMSNVNTTMINISPRQHMLNSIKKIGTPESFGIKKGQSIYHGTTIDAKQSIETYGFDINRCKRGEAGKGFYFGFDKEGVAKSYGDGVVEARYIGNNVAEIEPGALQGIQYSYELTSNLAEKLNLNKYNDTDRKIIDDIINMYYQELLNEKNISALYASRSLKAGRNYLMIPNMEHLEIL